MVAVAIALGILTAPKPVFALKLDGSVVSPSPVNFRAGTKAVKTPGGVGLEVLDNSGGLMMLDHNAFALETALTVCVWVKPIAYNISGPQAQIMFRGDDRPGIDPYSLAIHNNGTVFLIISDESNQSAEVTSTSKLPINVWSHVLATFDANNQQMRIYVNGKLEAMKETKLRPIGPLEAKDAAGLGIGNVQWDKGPHNQPYHGTLADLRLYNVVLTPKDVGYDGTVWKTQ